MTFNFWIQQAHGQVELDKQIELVSAHQPGTKMCWTKKSFLNHEEPLV